MYDFCFDIACGMFGRTIRQVVGDLYQALLTLYDPQIPTALGSACLRLLESERGRGF